MKEQKIVVEYLRNDQRLLIPAALGMSITGVGRCATNPVLVDRDKRAATMTYADIRSLIIPLSSHEEVREGVAAFQPAGRFPDWSNNIRYTYQDVGCFVGGLAWATTDQILHEAFSQYGEIIDSKIIKDRETGRSRGFGFVTLGNEKAMRDAIEGMNGTDLHGRNITVTEAQSCGSGGGGPDAQTNFTKPPVSKQHTRDAKCYFVLIDISEDGFVSLLTANGNTKDDLRLPTQSVPLRTLALKIEYDAIAVAIADGEASFIYEIETRKACNGGGGKDPGNADSLMKGNLWNQQCGLTIVMSIWFFILLKRGSLNRKFSTAQSSILEDNCMFEIEMQLSSFWILHLSIFPLTLIGGLQIYLLLDVETFLGS
ncbi:hypothetical protein DKX38_028021 [Salix brachista]|uniref:RRM domain-containing protein n=1 Tax=Salix brachista TaxID=2182728 RepID=A0A5N5J981_9ROSI|nr:hypothetical protein DKX38_028021 [Salix brachista]